MATSPRAGAKDDDVIMDIDTTPLIDVMLVLLVMLIITIPIQLHSVNYPNLPIGNIRRSVKPRSSRSTSTARGRRTGTARCWPTARRSRRS